MKKLKNNMKGLKLR